MRSYCNAENIAVSSRSDYLLGYASVIFSAGFDEYYLLPIVIIAKPPQNFSCGGVKITAIFHTGQACRQDV